MKPLRWQSEVELSVNSIHQKNAYAQHRRGRAAYSARRCHCYSFLSCGWHFSRSARQYACAHGQALGASASPSFRHPP